MSPDPGGEPADGPADPFADLLFTLIAAVLPAILVLLPAMHLSGALPPRPSRAEPPPAPVTVRGQSAWPIVAQRDGLRLTEASNRVVSLDAIPDDGGLRALLQRLRDAGEPLVLVIEPDGQEAAFVLEPLAAAQGPQEIQQIRADRPCGEARGALARACGAATARAEGR